MNRYCKKGIIVIIVSIVFLFMISCLSKDEKTDVTIDYHNSYYLHYEVKGGEVIIKCHYTVINNTESTQLIQLRGCFEKDQKLGLIKESQLIASNAPDNGSSFFEVLPGNNELDVYYIGTFGGTDGKTDRLIPDTDILLS